MNVPAKNKFKMMGNCKYLISLMQDELGLTITGVGGRDIVDGNTNLLFGILWMLMRESYIAKHGPKSENELQNWADGFLEEPIVKDIEVFEEDLDELPYAVVLYRGGEGEIFMGDDVDLLECPQMPTSFEKMVVDPCSNEPRLCLRDGIKKDENSTLVQSESV